MLFKNRRDAGSKLASKLQHYKNKNDVIVLALPRGGVPVAFEIAMALHVPLDVFIIRKLGVPGQEELAMGAIASGGVVVINQAIVEYLGISNPAIQSTLLREAAELARREDSYRRGRSSLELEGKQIILVDDGLATGASMKAAVKAVRKANPMKVVVAVPVAAPEIAAEMEDLVDEIDCFATPDSFVSVGSWYQDFTQTTDEEVRFLLDQAAKLWSAA